ncbi:MAG: HAD-IIB family hydrolase [Flexistipes sinusarabici]|uniref:HAD-IIB family hydrolase n=1 Tax=Flexistipes sinusarabici TaxID=2352 RepID=A0A5D0MIR1_FLESI|nr:HAD-IIB family hydrolase [Flexistipes sinusarabici]TYB33614.1 MAG: HAD-IIB family hydrolase [Flexistipes sinusarabici]
MQKFIIFTDLDGTLLDHDTYSFAAAEEALSLIKSENIPLIIVTSKTSSEVFDVQKQLGISHPFIVENGGAVFFPEEFADLDCSDCEKQNNYFVKTLGAEREKILGFLEPLKSDLKVRSFVGFSDDELSKLMDMNIEETQKSKKREFSEPFIFLENEKENFNLLQKKALESGFKILKGGRFYHLIGRSQDKGEAVKIVKSVYSIKYGRFSKSIGIGDSMNDYEMLKQMDIPVLVAKKDGTYENIHLPGLIKAGAAGPEGWNKVVLNYIL